MKIRILKYYDDLQLKRPMKPNEEIVVENKRGMFLINNHLAEIIGLDEPEDTYKPVSSPTRRSQAETQADTSAQEERKEQPTDGRRRRIPQE